MSMLDVLMSEVVGPRRSPVGDKSISHDQPTLDVRQEGARYLLASMSLSLSSDLQQRLVV